MQVSPPYSASEFIAGASFEPIKQPQGGIKEKNEPVWPTDYFPDASLEIRVNNEERSQIHFLNSSSILPLNTRSSGSIHDFVIERAAEFALFDVNKRPAVTDGPPSPVPTYVKVNGSWWNPRTWWLWLKSAFRGAPENSIGMKGHRNATSGATGGFVIDGFDDVANALQNSGLPKQMTAGLSAFVFFPVATSLVHMGAEGAYDALKDSDNNYKENRDRLLNLKRQLTQKLNDLPGHGNQVSETDSEVKWRESVARGIAAAWEDQTASVTALMTLLVEYQKQYQEGSPLRMAIHEARAGVVGTHAMLGGVLLYWGGSLSQFIGTGSASAAINATTAAGSALTNITVGAGAAGATSVLMLTGHLVMFIGQVAMTVYAGIGMAGGIKGQMALSAQRAEIKGDIKKSEAKPDTTAPEVKEISPRHQDALARNKIQKRLNFWGKIFGNGLLAVGQIFMLLGGAIVGFGLPLLIVGAILTVAAIILKVVMEKRSAALLSFDDKAFNQAEVIFNRTPQQAMQFTEQLRQQALRVQAWTSLMAELKSIRADDPTLLAQGELHRLDARMLRLHTGDHEQELHCVMKDVWNEHKDVFAKCMEDSTPGLLAYVSLLPAQDLEPLSVENINKRIDDFKKMNRRDRFELLTKLKGLDDEWQRRTINQLVVHEAGGDNINGKRYSEPGYITSQKDAEERTGMWGLWQWMLGSKTKTAYALNLTAILNDLNDPAMVENPSGPLDHVENVVYKAIEKTVFKSTLQRSIAFGAHEFLMQLNSAEAELSAARPQHGDGISRNGMEVPFQLAPEAEPIT